MIQVAERRDIRGNHLVSNRLGVLHFKMPFPMPAGKRSRRQKDLSIDPNYRLEKFSGSRSAVAGLSPKISFNM
jgi:hypothetical protein